MMTDVPEGDDYKALRDLVLLIVVISGAALLIWKVMNLMEILKYLQRTIPFSRIHAADGPFRPAARKVVFGNGEILLILCS